MEHLTQNKIQVKLNDIANKQYDIVVGENLSDLLIEFLQKQDSISNVVIITDSTVEKLYGESLLSDLKDNLQSSIFNLLSFPAGEQYKMQETVTKLQNQMFKLKCGRDTMVIALGGGVAGDVVGFVAATYMRGIPYIQVPTTMLAMVDSSVGGKTGIDNEFGKNLIGAFCQPEAVFVDVEVLRTLQQEHIVSGLVEATKMFLTHDKKCFEYVKDNYEDIVALDAIKVKKVITRAVEIKSAVVMQDEKESGERSILNLGHTIGHAMEKLSNYEMLHGYAVGLGVLVEAKIAVLIGKLSEKDYLTIEELLCRMVNKKDIFEFDAKQVLKETQLDKKTKDGETKFVLLRGVGIFCKKDGEYVHSVEEKHVLQALKYFYN